MGIYWAYYAHILLQRNPRCHKWLVTWLRSHDLLARYNHQRTESTDPSAMDSSVSLDESDQWFTVRSTYGRVEESQLRTSNAVMKWAIIVAAAASRIERIKHLHFVVKPLLSDVQARAALRRACNGGSAPPRL